MRKQVATVKVVLLRFRRLIASFLIVIIFFSFYNIFLIDRTLENLSFVLEQTASAENIEDIAGLELVLTQTATSEIYRPKLNELNVGNLEYAKTIITSGEVSQQMDYAAVALQTLISDKEKKRGLILSILDRINRPIRNTFIYLVYLPRYIFRLGQAAEAAETREPGTLLLEKAASQDRAGNLEKAAQIYETFIKTYRKDERVVLAALKLAYIYNRLGKLDKAISLYKSIVKMEYPARTRRKVKELIKFKRIAEIILDKLEHKDKVIALADKFIAESAGLTDQQKAALFSQAAKMYAELLYFKEARKWSLRASELTGVNGQAPKYSYETAWATKQIDSQKAKKEFAELTTRYPESNEVLHARYQIADIDYARHNYEKALESYIALADESKGKNVAALYLFQAIDLAYLTGKEQLAEALIARLGIEAPQSFYSKYYTPPFLLGILDRLTCFSKREICTHITAWVMRQDWGDKKTRFKAALNENTAFKVLVDWLGGKFPASLAGMYVDCKIQSFKFEKMRNGEIATIANGKIILFKERIIPYTVVGSLRIAKNGQLDFKLRKIRMWGWFPLPAWPLNIRVNKIVKAVNGYIAIDATKLSVYKRNTANVAYAEGFMPARLGRIAQVYASDFFSVEQKPEEFGNLFSLEKLAYPKDASIYGKNNKMYPWLYFAHDFRYDDKLLFKKVVANVLLYYIALNMVEETKKLGAEPWLLFGKRRRREYKRVINWTQEGINDALNLWVKTKFPMVKQDDDGNIFVYNIKNASIVDMKNGPPGDIDILMSAEIEAGYGPAWPIKIHRMKVGANLIMTINKKTGLVVTEVTHLAFNCMPYKKLGMLNAILRRFSHDILKDSCITLRLKVDKLEVLETVNEKGAVTKTLRADVKGNKTFLNQFFPEKPIKSAFLREKRKGSEVYTWYLSCGKTLERRNGYWTGKTLRIEAEETPSPTREMAPSNLERLEKRFIKTDEGRLVEKEFKKPQE